MIPAGGASSCAATYAVRSLERDEVILIFCTLLLEYFISAEEVRRTAVFGIGRMLDRGKVLSGEKLDNAADESARISRRLTFSAYFHIKILKGKSISCTNSEISSSCVRNYFDR